MGLLKTALKGYKYSCQFFNCDEKKIEDDIYLHEMDCPKKTILCPAIICPNPEVLESNIFSNTLCNHAEIIAAESLVGGWNFAVPVASLFDDWKSQIQIDPFRIPGPKHLLLRQASNKLEFDKYFKLLCIFTPIVHYRDDLYRSMAISLVWSDNTLLQNPSFKNTLENAAFEIRVYDDVSLCLKYPVGQRRHLRPLFRKSTLFPTEIENTAFLNCPDLRNSWQRLQGSRPCNTCKAFYGVTYDSKNVLPHIHVDIKQVQC